MSPRVVFGRCLGALSRGGNTPDKGSSDKYYDFTCPPWYVSIEQVGFFCWMRSPKGSSRQCLLNGIPSIDPFMPVSHKQVGESTPES